MCVVPNLPAGRPGHLTKLQMLQKIKEKYAHAASIIFNYAQIKTSKTLTKTFVRTTLILVQNQISLLLQLVNQAIASIDSLGDEDLHSVRFYCTRMYPMALMCLSPLSPETMASLPHVLKSSCFPPVPKPILESQVLQSFSLLPRIPILAFAWDGLFPTTLNPSLLHLVCNEACEPMRDFHVLRPSDVAR